MARRAHSSLKKHTENFYNVDNTDHNDRFQSMYQATLCRTAKKALSNRPVTADQSPDERRVNNKTADVQASRNQYNNPLMYTSPSSQYRKFGEYGVPAANISNTLRIQADLSPAKRSEINQLKHAMSATAKHRSPFTNLPTGYEGARQTRCTDRFVRYPYPKLYSNYKQNYADKIKDAKITSHKEAFNLEKESKIINPHRMERTTTNLESYKKFKVGKQQEPARNLPKEAPPNTHMSSYQASFPNWKNGQNDIFHEKEPQFPVYSLPFAGDSSYKKSFTNQQLKELQRQRKILSETKKTGTIKMASYTPQPFMFETTNSKAFRDFKVQGTGGNGKPYPVTIMNQKPEAVQTVSFPSHFGTTNRNEFKKHTIQSSKVDKISYP